MSKMRKELVIKTTAMMGTSLHITHYPKLSKKRQKKIIDRLHKKCGGVLLSDKQTEFFWPEAGVRAVRCKADGTGSLGIAIVYGKPVGVQFVPSQEYPYIWSGEHNCLIPRN